MHHDISCDCCSDKVGVSIPIVKYLLKQIIFPIIQTYNMPMIFQNNWAPQMMPTTNMAVANNFLNPQIN